MSTTLIQSTLHGRKRRLLRRIEKTDIEDCLAFGIKEPSIKGRWKYTYNEVVLIMDPTNTTEITSFVMPLEMERAEYDNYYVDEHNEAKKAIIQDKTVCASHTIIVMDMSGSMRRADVANFVTRYKAVVSTIASEYIAFQLIRHQVKNSDVVTIIRMGTESDVLIEREPISWVLYNMVLDLRFKRPDFHGNYIPALEKTKELFDKYDHPNVALCMFFLSDGKSSDSYCCKGLNHALSETYISDELRTIAQQYGSRLSTNFIGFGPYTGPYDFEILEKLSEISEEYGCVSQFIHSKLDSTILKDSINSSAKRLSETRISLATTGGRTLRPSLGTKENPTSSYFFYSEVQKKVWSSIDNNWILKPLAQGVALCKDKLGVGAERVVFSLHLYYRHDSASEEILSAGFRFKQSELVGKESKFVEDVQSSEHFHKTFIITQQKASELAIAFNSSIANLPSFCNNTTPSISFLDCYLFYVPSKQISILAEKQLETKIYKKFNDNMGGVDGQASHPPINLHKGLHNMNTMLNAIQEAVDGDDDDDEEEDDSNLARIERVSISSNNGKIDPNHIPQAFSHFTYRYSNRKLLVCDLQGVFNANTIPPTYELTDPVIHYRSSRGIKNTFGRTDCGKEGILDFFRSHICNPLCKLVLPQKKKKAQKRG